MHACHLCVICVICVFMCHFCVQVDEVSIYIPMYEVVTNGVNFMDVLMGIPENVIAAKQEKIASIAPRLQYSKVPSHFLDDAMMDFVLSNAGHGGEDVDAGAASWSPPFLDAADIIVGHITDPVTTYPKQPGQMSVVRQQEIMNQVTNSNDYPDFSLLTRPECVTMDVLNNYIRGFHPHWNGKYCMQGGSIYVVDNSFRSVI